MSGIISKNNRANEPMLSIEQLRTFPGMEKYSDAELKELAVLLKEFSLIIYDTYSKSKVGLNDF